MRTLYFDCFNGAGGDMIVASLIDAGADAPRLIEALAGLSVGGYRVQAEKVRKQGFAATQFHVELDESTSQPHRHLSHIHKILADSDLPDRVRTRANAAFERLADAEAEAHGTTREKVHFHEVGAVDAIVDIVGAMLALEELGPQRIVCSPVPVGSGTVTCAHGVMPVPAPATAILLKGVPIAATEETGELLTPTAAAVLTTVCDAFVAMPAMTVERIGMGAGTREGKSRPNLLRAFVGEAAEASATETVCVLEANLDDCPGEWVGHCLARVLAEGARDAYCVPIYMKKSRPGVVLTVICDPGDAPRLEAVLFAETSTFGVRRSTMQRSVLTREHVVVETPYGPIRVKVGRSGDRDVQAAPEYEDCAAAATRHGVALRAVMAAATAAWQGKRT
ncbi:MAG TPA: nickel pincer cofactor biosynthesis protein LarC [Phycisphaerae bacterium]|nr:nickel pincer cofactor biosynthesis protein LarC [Phycisphaerae bacterium]